MTIFAAVLGYPAGHSRSPAMHNAAYRELGMDWFYVAIEVPPERFEERVLELPGQGFVGANVTIPHKLAALELADRASNAARAIGAANMLTFVDGEIEAENTDAAGMAEILREQGLAGDGALPALVLGAGGAGRAVVWALLEAGAEPVYLWNRTPDRAAELVAHLADYVDTDRIQPVSDPSEAVATARLLVNATAIGMGAKPYMEEPTGAAELELSGLNIEPGEPHAGQTLVDLTYRPGGTALARTAAEHGLTVVDGLDFLVHQGAASFRLWTGREPPIEVMRRAAARTNG